MIKFYCDKCGKEVQDNDKNNVSISLRGYTLGASRLLCSPCSTEFINLVEKYMSKWGKQIKKTRL